jgi:hypothetical protein
MLAPGRDDTTRGAVAAGAGGVGETGEGTSGASGVADAAGATTGAAAGAGVTGATTAAGATAASAGVVTAASSPAGFFARGFDGVFFGVGSPSASPSAAAFFVFFGLSGAGSRFKPFSSA